MTRQTGATWRGHGRCGVGRYGSPDHAAVQAALQLRLLRWLIQTSDVVKRREDPRWLPEQIPAMERLGQRIRARAQKAAVPAATAKL